MRIVFGWGSEMRVLGSRTMACMVGLALALAPAPAWAETSSEVREQAAAVQSELDELTSQIEDGEAKLEELQNQVDSLAEESVALQTKLIEDRDRLAQIVVTSYKENSDARVLALLLSSQTLDELISQAYYAQKVSNWQAECINQLNADKEELDVRMAKISKAKDEQEATIEELDEKRDELDEKVAVLIAHAEQLEEEEREAARKAAEEAARKAEEERKAKEAREAAERERQEAIRKAQEAGDVPGNADAGDSSVTPPGSGWITCVASAYTIADNDPPGSTATASGVPLDESVPTVAMPMSMSPSRFYGRQIQISYNGMTVVATVTDCGAMGGGSRGLDLTPAIFRAFGASSADEWGLRTVSYRFL